MYKVYWAYGQNTEKMWKYDVLLQRSNTGEPSVAYPALQY